MVKQIVLLDNNVWDILRKKGCDLLVEAGSDLDFRVSDLGIIEVPSPDHARAEAVATGIYAREQLERLASRPVEWFRLSDGEARQGGGGLGDLQSDGTVLGGGFLTSVEGRDFIEDPTRHKKVGGETGESLRPTGLLQNQTDVDYGEWSMAFPLVTRNVKDFKRAGRIIDISFWTKGGFGDFVRGQLS
ncbi:hypothetical protein [Pseudomonas sp. RIT-PI-S]|uniref:hypothetical protein n=1 Tax=Pseudomonas sp. RIT-PI-S TaxID=3035295 RepID=UPI0021D8ECD5|nr:hypothetical protein [Pseudomonas sp. RIT-PI-S]